jgi:hypothetical protein
MKKYEDFRKVNEVRRPKQCPILDFSPIINSEVYKDMMAMGFVEVSKDKYDEIQTIRSDAQRSFKDSLGNMGFYHPLLGGRKKPGYPYYNIRFDKFKDAKSPDFGLSYLTVKINTAASKTAEYPGMKRKTSNCITIEDYFSIMGFLIKVLVQRQGFPITDQELMNDESYKDLIRRKMEDNPSLISKMEILPPSLKQEDLGKSSAMLKRFGVFGDDED